MKIVLCMAAMAAMALSAQAQTARPVQTFQTSAGPVKITPIYHATVLVEGGGKTIYLDPAKPANLAGLPPADLILITHEHGDHVDQDQSSIKTISKPDTQVWVTSTVKKFVPTGTVISNGDKKTFDKWTIEAVPAYNLVRGPAAGKFYHPKGVGNGYVLSYGGKRFYFSGDTEATPEMQALKNIDVAFVCMNLPYTMTPDEAADAVKAFHPKIVIPYHYRAMPATDLNEFKQKLAGTGIEVRMLEWYPTT